VTNCQCWKCSVHIERTELRARGWLKIVRKSEKSFTPKTLGAPAEWAAHEGAELPYLRAEEDRVMYVAATRARKMLVVSRWSKTPRNAAWGVFDLFLNNAVELPVPLSVCVAPVAPLDCRTDAQTAAFDAQGKAHALVSQASWAITSVTAEAGHIARLTRSFAASADDPSKVVTIDTPAHRGDAGQAWGTLIHGLLEHAMRQKDATGEDLHRLGMWLTVEEPHLRSVLDLAVKTVLQVSKAEFWNEARKSERSVETPFAFTEKRDAILTGVIDLMFGHEVSWRIIDYKTDVNDAELVASYQAQLKMYERALASVGIQDVTSAIQRVRSD
jgi:ATP-dependent helicase/nuclease subunit A